MDVVGGDLCAIFKALNLSAVNLLGYSMGGRVALYLAINAPSMIQSLILESTTPGLERPDQRLARIQSDKRLAREIEVFGIPAFVEQWQQLPLFASQKQLPEDRRERLHHQRLKNKAVGLANSLRGMGTGCQPSLWLDLQTVYLPVLLLAGALDQKYVAIAQQMFRTMPQAELNIVPNAGHNIHMEQPSYFTNRVLNFLEKLKVTGQN